MSDNAKTILVTGATGTVGSQTTKILLERGAKVRVGVRSPEKVSWAKELGAEVVALDFTDEAATAAALSGVDRALLLAPFVAEFHNDASRVARQAKQAGVSHVVRISALGANPEAELNVARWHGSADAALVDSGLGYTILQPTFFQDNVLKFHADSIKGQSAFYGASAGKPVAYISSADIAAVAAEVLLSPEAHAGQTYVLTGGEALSDEGVAALISEAAGKAVSYVDVGGEQMAASMRENQIPDWLVEAMVGLEGVKAAGWAAEVSPAVEQLLGRAPESYAAFLQRSGGALS